MNKNYRRRRRPFLPAGQLLFFIPLVCILIITTVTEGQCASQSRFPLYPAIRQNVLFWEKIYSHYSINSAVIHDRDDLSKIYNVIDLLESDLPGAERLNRAAQKAVEEKYRKALHKLSKGKRPSNAIEKQLARMYNGRNSRKKMARAAEMVRSQTGQKERFLQGVIRSGAYMGRLRKIFQSQGLPIELAYLPHVESSFNTKAYSKFGAAGMWQFTRATGKQYMQINEAIDERRDPYIAADAAARYLKNSYKNLGNWPLALTSYNYGTAGMMRAQKAKGSYEKIFLEYSDGHFGFASRNFYSEFLAALHVAQRLEKNPAVKRHKPERFSEVALPDYISLNDLLHHFKLTSNTVKKLNPALKPLIYKGKRLIPRGYALRLPEKSGTRQIIASIPKSYYRSSQKTDHVYRVRKGDTAGAIAFKHDISIKQLIAANSLDRNAAIYISQRLRIPGSEKTKARNNAIRHLSAETKKQFSAPPSPSVSHSRTAQSVPVLSENNKTRPSSVPGTIVVKEGGKREQIKVQPEESLALYASWLKITEKQLRRTNSINRLDPIYPGQKITVEYTNVSAAVFAEQRAAFIHDNEEDFFSSYKVIELRPYLVQNGDTLWELCNKTFNIPLWLLKKYNRNLNLSKIQPRQELTVPLVRAL